MLLLAEAKQHRLSALISVALALGLRKSEALGLRWSDVDLDNGVLSVRYQIQRVDGTWTFVPPKSNSARRTLPLPPVLIDELRKHRTEQMEERLAAGPDWHDYNLVFCTQSGQPIASRNLTTAFTRMLRRAGLGHHRWHDLRHTSATFLAAQGVHPRVAMQILGHSQISLTMNIYTHVADDVQREAIDRLAGLFDSQNDSQTA